MTLQLKVYNLVEEMESTWGVPTDLKKKYVYKATLPAAQMNTVETGHIDSERRLSRGKNHQKSPQQYDFCKG